jgi:hypothetical protein
MCQGSRLNVPCVQQPARRRIELVNKLVNKLVDGDAVSHIWVHGPCLDACASTFATVLLHDEQRRRWNRQE